jgi:hypothetical protein
MILQLKSRKGLSVRFLVREEVNYQSANPFIPSESRGISHGCEDAYGEVKAKQ